MDSHRPFCIARTALIGLLVGACVAQFQHQPSYNFNQQRSQQRTNYFDQQQPNNFRGFAQQNQFAQAEPQYQQQQQQQQQRSFSPSAGGGSCPERNGRFPVPSQCDAYIECTDGVPEQKLCPEGLLFNPEARFNYPCGYPIDVQCLGRSQLQPAQPSEECPHQYGYFKIGDRQNCGKFKNCVEGRAYEFDCPEGLAYNPDTYRCDWPDQVADCDAEAFLGFTCPTSSGLNAFISSETRFYRSPNDCQRYYVCVNDKPRLQNCGEGHAFNELINACDAAENVTGCAPPPSLNDNYQPVQLSGRQQNSVRSFNSANSFSQPQTFNQQQNFGAFNQQQNSRGQQNQRNQYSRQRFSSNF